ncbi:MAG: glycosyltransferase family A protein [Planctomycetota bacterium]
MMQEPPQVSVVIPTCDRRGVLARCLSSLVSQTHASFEIIVVDDGSVDDTPVFLQAFADEHPGLRFCWLRNEERLGANPSRNRGIREAAGEFVAFIDSDCAAAEDWLERLMHGFSSERVGAVTGLVRDPLPTNIYELTFKGTHRLGRPGAARRLVGGNMCIRRELLLEYPLDEDLKHSCDEEGVFLRLRAGGYEQRVVPEAVVDHEHYYTRQSFFRQARQGSESAARLVYKYYLPQRLDMLPFMLAYASLPLILADVRLAAAPGFFFAAALAAIAYNDLFRKGKTIGETLRSFPVLLAYYHVRLCGYIVETIRLRLCRHGLRRVRLDKAPDAAPDASAG